MLAIAEMYVQGVSTRDAAKVMAEFGLKNDPTKPATQFPGWPVTVGVLDNYGGNEPSLLPKLKVKGATNPAIQVVSEDNGEIVYTLRGGDPAFQPKVFAQGKSCSPPR